MLTYCITITYYCFTITYYCITITYCCSAITYYCVTYCITYYCVNLLYYHDLRMYVTGLTADAETQKTTKIRREHLLYSCCKSVFNVFSTRQRNWMRVDTTTA